ncbi:hypothetical protein WOLCODRAFT_139400 [Wolfiporia cocos MD-104 SS10]|uniref:Conserved oligomeric Golgi complex subunit 7 n=1 Tax=Wolfiporia cocos (strain MD-104) TaxID=742152 RepID=A0A2H3JSK2_WOLCO|nr:hypothetical protein WOLCODRAFT_139400 [Wolfiporia cocos MD-104 SS10]
MEAQTVLANTAPRSYEVVDGLEHATDVVPWIDEALGTNEDSGGLELVELDRKISSLIGALEIASEDTTVEVERLINDISRGASRLTYDLHFMRDGALSLQSVLHNVESQSRTSVAAETHAALDRLHFLDTVRRNMEAARVVLREAESWGTLESDVTSLLGEKNYEKAAERLSEASKSMAVFANTPEYESRRTLMVSLQNQLEASLSSALVAAVSSQDVAVCRNYFAIFSNIQREAEFRNYYYGSRRASLTEAWQNAKLRENEGSSYVSASVQNSSTFLSTFYSSFLAILQTERTSIPAIFPDPQPTLSALITSTLSALQPTFSQRLAVISTYHGANALHELIAAYRATQDFALAVDKIFEKLGFSTTLSPSVASDADEDRTYPRRRTSTRRLSMTTTRRMSMHRASMSGAPPAPEYVPMIPVLEWDTDLFASFADFQADYASLEGRCLDETLAGALCATPTPARGADRARILRERVVDVFAVAEEAIGRCMAFTHGYGAVGLVQAVDHLVVAFADTSRTEVARNPGGIVITGVKAGGGDDLADLDYTAEDWAEIQALLHLLEAVRVLLDRTLAFEGKLRLDLVQVSMAFRAARQNVNRAGTYGGAATTRGAIQILMQSELNSAALHALLDSVDPEPPATAQAQLAPSVPPSPDLRKSSFAAPPNANTPINAVPLLIDSRKAISAFAQACQVRLQQTILGPLFAHLAPYAALPLWAAPDNQSKRQAATSAAGGAISAVHVPTFSLSPSSTMARVAEGLLSLPRLFEVYADDDALAVSLETLPHVSEKFLRAVAEPAPAPVAPHGPPEIKQRRSPSMALLPGQMQIQAAMAPTQLQSIGDLHFSPEGVTAAWLASLTRSLLAHLTREVLPKIPKLTTSGAAQLAADLGWLANIAEALNVEWTPLTRWKRWVEQDESERKKKLVVGTNCDQEEESLDQDSQSDGEDEEEEDGEDRIAGVVARLRGWSV